MTTKVEPTVDQEMNKKIDSDRLDLKPRYVEPTVDKWERNLKKL